MYLANCLKHGAAGSPARWKQHVNQTTLTRPPRPPRDLRLFFDAPTGVGALRTACSARYGSGGTVHRNTSARTSGTWTKLNEKSAIR